MLKFGSKHDSNIVFKCTVRLLEDTEILECEYKPHHKGKYLLEYVCQQLNLIEQDYLGLRYVDNQDQRHWLDLGKSICKQVKDLDPVLFSFRVKFYPPDPSGELGDYDPEIHVGNYISEMKIFLKQTEAIEEKAMEIHQKQLKGQSQSQVEQAFLKIACHLDSYGVDPHPVKDHKRSQLYLGINYSGILTFQGSRKTHHFRWPDIQKINYEGKMFIIHLNYNDKKHTVGFKCPSGQACRHVWRCAIEQMLFFTLPTSSDAPSVVTGGGFFSWGTKFKYTGRTEKEILGDNGSPGREEPTIQRSSSVRRKASSVPATPSTPLQPHLGYCSLPRSSHSDVGGSRMESSSSTGLLSGLDGNASQAYSDVAALETVSEDQEAIGAVKLRTTVLKDDSIDRFSDFYFRDSFEHSSSESQLIDNSYRGYDTRNPSHRSSRSQTPLSHSQVDGRICLPNTTNPVHTNTKKWSMQLDPPEVLYWFQLPISTFVSI
nr:FERM domain-containing protein 3-like [Leptinotarsa decemlineata]